MIFGVVKGNGMMEMYIVIGCEHKMSACIHASEQLRFEFWRSSKNKHLGFTQPYHANAIYISMPLMCNQILILPATIHPPSPSLPETFPYT